MLDVSIIIVNRNGKAITLECFKSLLNQKCKEIILVDNASTDGSIAALSTFAKRHKLPLQVVSNTTNNGFAEANNQGFELATGKYIVFLNNDTVVTPNFLPPLIEVLKKNSKVAAVQPLILFPNGTIDSVGSYLTPTGFLYHRAHRQQPRKEVLQEAQVYSMKGACMVWKKAVLDQIGVFDQSFFAYFEETELCHRAINNGYQLLYSPRSRITHLGGFTSNSMPQPFLQFHNTKNRFITYLKHLPSIQLFEILPIHLLLCEALVIKTMTTSLPTALAIQRGIFVGLYRGFKERFTFTLSGLQRRSLKDVTRTPGLSYYQALFSSLENYQELW